MQTVYSRTSTLAAFDSGRPILGDYPHNSGPIARWMGTIPDSTPIELLNIPGTHDAAAWNYSGPDSAQYLCQGFGFWISALGTRPDHSKLLFYHSAALLSDTATLQDVLQGLYYWLDHHRTETLLLSLKVDNGPTDAALEQEVYNLIATGPGRHHWVQTPNEVILGSISLPNVCFLRVRIIRTIHIQLGTLGHARGKAILLRRFSWADLPSPTPSALPGVNLNDGFADNDPDFVIPYNPLRNLSAHVEDYYAIYGNDTVAQKVDTKVQAVAAHIQQAVQGVNNTSNFWMTFASGGGFVGDLETIVPKTLAEGDGSTTPGVNAKLSQILNTVHAGKRIRVGAVLLDFYESVGTLVQDIIGPSHQF
ncbi:hypothetical protein BS47DRAFT_1395962 [Hydnum rufescens UP504]|uniref:PLC-like phosphodiesterase n=1 Tax=Hydnum rufescens UP504 TaxID=1448309 RepID=A0A9P6AR02_9AGAM|nr:hypothetical protein BS47DRAFT_1395962 [Hydnum rufescens UP504]